METQTATTRHWTSFGEHAHFAEPNRTLQQPSDQTIPHRALHPINHSRSMDGRVPKRFTSASSCINCCTASDGVVACLPSLRRSSRGCPTFFNTISRFILGRFSRLGQRRPSSLQSNKAITLEKVTRGCIDLFRFGRFIANESSC